jgi:hypothetical protein
MPHQQSIDIVCDLQDESIDKWKRTLVESNLMHDKGADATETLRDLLNGRAYASAPAAGHDHRHAHGISAIVRDLDRETIEAGWPGLSAQV